MTKDRAPLLTSAKPSTRPGEGKPHCADRTGTTNAPRTTWHGGCTAPRGLPPPAGRKRPGCRWLDLVAGRAQTGWMGRVVLGVGVVLLVVGGTGPVGASAPIRAPHFAPSGLVASSRRLG